MSTGRGMFEMRLFLILAALSLWLPERALACSCVEQPFETARANAAAIFEARVAAIEDVDGTRHVHFDVVQTWLAAEHEHVEVVTATTEAACGYSFVVGQSYLVYASSVEDQAYRVSLCSRTRLMQDADDDRALLGSGVVPVDIEDGPEETPTVRTPPTRGGCASCSVTRESGGEMALFASFVITLVITRRRRK